MDKNEHERRIGFAREKAAQVWCKPTTEKIEMDCVLAEAFAETLVDEMYSPHLGCATTQELLDEIGARCGDLNYKTVGSD